MKREKKRVAICGVLGAGLFLAAGAQTPTLTPQVAQPATATQPAGSSSTSNPTHTSTTAPAPGSTTPGAATTAPLTQSATASLTLSDVLSKAQALDLTYAAAIADARVAEAQRGIARSALLPTVVYHNQFVYTEPLRGPTGATVVGGAPRFVANNAVHEYVSQGLATETISAASVADFRKSYYEAAAAKAKLEVARRGLIGTVVTNYYAALGSAEKLKAQQEALDQALHFDKVSAQLEAGGEVAHLDVVKSHLQVQQREREIGDAQLAVEKARIDLGVLLFTDPLTGYALSGNLTSPPMLPSREQVKASANMDNPDLKAALASFKAASLELTSSRLDYLPAFSVQYSYGIDAPEFAATGNDGTRYLGYAAVATLDIPIFDWFATRERGRQSAARKQLAQLTLTFTQRQLAASIENFYREAEIARAQLLSLDDSVRDAAEALRLTDLRYTSGEAPILEVIDAQNTVVTVRNARADAATRYYTALANLQTLTGNQP